MKKFLVHSSLFFILISVSLLIVFYQADGYSDTFYVRFTTPKQNSLILGTSKAAHGIMPSELLKVLPDDSIFNFAFTIAHSPYGPAYLKGIKRKLLEDTRNGVFIIGLDAWSIADSSEDPNDESQFDENKSFLNKLGTVSSKPNIPHLLSFYKNTYAKIFKRDTIAFLHDDGWLEVKTDMNEDVVARRIKNKIERQIEKKKSFRFSKTRLSYLYETITYLQEKGEVYLVKLPVHPDLLRVDDDVVPNFDELMIRLSKDTSAPYYDMSDENENYQYVDGIHLYRDSSKEVTKKIALWIKELRSERKMN
jgi:hypothetical protein